MSFLWYLLAYVIVSLPLAMLIGRYLKSLKEDDDNDKDF